MTKTMADAIPYLPLGLGATEDILGKISDDLFPFRPADPTGHFPFSIAEIFALAQHESQHRGTPLTLALSQCVLHAQDERGATPPSSPHS